MNRITSLALAAMLTPTLALGIGSAFADEQKADRENQLGYSEESGMTSDDDRGQQSRETGQPGATSEEGRDRQAGSRDQPGMSEGEGHDRTGMTADDDHDDDAPSHVRYGDADQQEDHITSKPQDGYSADDLIGQDVKSRGSDDSVGTVNDLVIDSEGKVVAVIIGTGGRLGIGERNVAVNWNRVQLSFDDDEPSLSVDMDEDALKNAPEYESD